VAILRSPHTASPGTGTASRAGAENVKMIVQ
jgi:hypothetical protein